MTTGGVVAACAACGVVGGPLLELTAARTVRRRAATSSTAGAPSTAPAGVPAPPVPAVASVPGLAAEPPAEPPATVDVPATPPPRHVGAVRVAAGAVTGGLLALTAVRLGAVPQLAAYCVLWMGFVALSIVDLRVGLVPRKVLYPTLAVVAAGLVAASAADGRWDALAGAAIGGVAAFGVFAAVWWLYPKGLGFGDVRLAGVCGMALGWLGFTELYVGFLAAFVLGLLFGLGNLVIRGTTRFPFAPALAAGTAVGVLWGSYLGNLWLHHG